MAVPAHDERDFEFAQAFGLEIRRVVAAPGEAADEPMAAAYVAHAAGERPGQQRPVRRAARRRGRQGDRGLAGRDRTGRAQGHLPVARLAGQPPALLGHARSRSSTARRDGIVPVPDDRPAGPPARDGRLHGQRRQPAQPRRGVPARRLPALRRPGPARDRHDGHVHGLVVVLVPLPVAGRAGRPGRPRDDRHAGRRSTSTRAAPSTRSCTCCTPASSPRRWPTSGWSRDREPFQRLFNQGQILGADGERMSQVARQRPGPRRARRTATARTRSGCS